MKENLFSKIVVTIIIGLMIAFVSFFAIIFTAFSGGQKFYSPMIAIIAVGLLLFTITKIFQLARPKRANISLLCFFVMCGLATAGYEVYTGYHEGVPTVNEQGVNLNDYHPFMANTKVSTLEEASTLRLEGPLPRLDGATALYPLYSAFVKATYPEKEYDIYKSEVICSTTPHAYENLIHGNVDIIFAARPSKEQLEIAKAKGIELKLTPIGREAFVFFVNSRNPVSELSSTDIQAIYSGEITNWKELGGQNEKIRAFQRPENSGSQTMLQKFMGDKKLMSPPKEDVVAGMGGIIERTSNYKNYKNAIGYSFLFFATEMIKNNEIKLLKVDGVKPDKETIQNKEYPLAAEFYAVTAGGNNPNIDAFIEWILSPQGQELVEKTGYTPISK